MDQRKIGSFLKELRKEKGLTQEQLAEMMNVSGRTVSRWETGSNMPDLDILIEMSDYYDVDIRELLDGERKSERMDQELKETIEKVADYSNEMKKRFTKFMHRFFIAGVFIGLLHLVLTMCEGKLPIPVPVYDFCCGLTSGIMFGVVIVGAIISSKNAGKILKAKRQMLGKAK